jgi:hypothetical protein
LVLVVIYFDILYLLVLVNPIGISRTNLDPIGWYCHQDCADGWFMHTYHGILWGNDKEYGDEAGGFEQGGRVGVLLDLGGGSLRFFRNGAQHGPGCAQQAA